MITSYCIICNQLFTKNAHNQLTCSKQCFIEHRKNRKRQREKLNTKIWTCKFCKEIFIRSRYRNGFCNRSCASKFYLDKGTYNKWIQTGVSINKEKLKNRKQQICKTCNNKYTVKPAEVNITKVCSRKCLYEMLSENFKGPLGPFFGQKHKASSMEKQKKTLLNRYGVNNAYKLAKNRRTISKGQRELFEIIKSNFDTSRDIKLEKLVVKTPKSIYADIVMPKDNIIIEYYGDYWHCNPNKYFANSYNEKKQLTAEAIWNQDKERVNILKQNGFRVFIVWEADFKNNKKQVVDNLLKQIRE